MFIQYGARCQDITAKLSLHNVSELSAAAPHIKKDVSLVGRRYTGGDVTSSTQLMVVYNLSAIISANEDMFFPRCSEGQVVCLSHMHNYPKSYG